MAMPVTIELVWREETGWSALMYGADGSSGHRIPIMEYLRWLHQLYKLPPNTMFGEVLPPPVPKKPRKKRAKRVVKKTRRKR